MQSQPNNSLQNIERGLYAVAAAIDRKAAGSYATNYQTSSFVLSSTSYQDTGFDLDIPSAGIWFVTYSVRMTIGAAGGFAVWRIWNETTAAEASADSTTIAMLHSGSGSHQSTTAKSIILNTSTACRLRLEAKLGGAYGGINEVSSDINGRSNVVALKIG